MADQRRARRCFRHATVLPAARIRPKGCDGSGTFPLASRLEESGAEPCRDGAAAHGGKETHGCKNKHMKKVKGEIMKHIGVGGIVFLALGTQLHAGGLERADQSVGVLFEKGRHLEFGIVTVSPAVSGVGALVTPGAQSGDLAQSFQNLRFAYKADINEKLSYAIIFDQPYGSNVAYPSSSFFAAGANAELTAHALTGILQYNIAEPGSALGGQLSVYGGARAQYIEASANVPFLNGYKATTDSNVGFGYVAGVAWERPELGMRVSLTYTSEIKNELDTQESFGANPATATKTDIDTPESISLEFQTGLNPKTLLFGSVRWVPWGDFDVSPPLYTGVTGSPLAFFADDRITYRLGIGRKINDIWTVFGEIGYEETTGSPTTNLTPVDGFFSYSLGATYKKDRTRITIAARYADVGDANSVLGAAVPAAQFTDNSLWGVGIRVAIDLN